MKRCGLPRFLLFHLLRNAYTFALFYKLFEKHNRINTNIILSYHPFSLTRETFFFASSIACITDLGFKLETNFDFVFKPIFFDIL